MTIELLRFRGAAYNFSITVGDKCFTTSNSIAKLLGLDVVAYNDVLVEHIIKHKDYKGDLFLDYFISSTDTKNNKDVTFNLMMFLRKLT